MRRTFDQYCPIARALEEVGERWSLLIVRELIFGPKRYTDLRRALPGMWTNLLATRLRDLEHSGVITRRDLPPPAARTVYELTERGAALEEVLLALGAWGMTLLAEREGAVPAPATAVLAGLKAFFRPEATENVSDVYSLRIGTRSFTATVHHGELAMSEREAEAPAVTLTAGPATLLAIRFRGRDIGSALSSGDISFSGNPAAIRRMQRAFSLR